MTTYFPEATDVLGNLTIKAILSVANPAAIKLSTEWNANTSLDLSCFVRPFNPTVNTGSGAKPRRACSTITLPGEGVTELQAFELNYIYDPQGDPTDPDNKAMALLQRGVVLTIGLRKGLDALTVPGTAGDKTEAWKVRLGRQNRGQSDDSDQAEFQISQMAYPLTDVIYGALVA